MRNKIISVYRKHYPICFREQSEKYLGRKVYHTNYDDLKSIFIHIPKTAGSSIGQAIFKTGTVGHWKASAYLWTNPKKYQAYFKFTFVRNPWDRLVSAYYYLHQGGKNKADRDWSERNLRHYSSFTSFVSNWLNEESIYSWGHFVPQYEFVKTPKENIGVDFIGKYENLKTDFDVVCKHLDLNVTLPKTNASNRPEYRASYNKKTLEIVEALYHKDIELFDYKF